MGDPLFDDLDYRIKGDGYEAHISSMRLGKRMDGYYVLVEGDVNVYSDYYINLLSDRVVFASEYARNVSCKRESGEVLCSFSLDRNAYVRCFSDSPGLACLLIEYGDKINIGRCKVDHVKGDFFYVSCPSDLFYRSKRLDKKFLEYLKDIDVYSIPFKYLSEADRSVVDNIERDIANALGIHPKFIHCSSSPPRRFYQGYLDHRRSYNTYFDITCVVGDVYEYKLASDLYKDIYNTLSKFR